MGKQRKNGISDEIIKKSVSHMGMDRMGALWGSEKAVRQLDPRAI